MPEQDGLRYMHRRGDGKHVWQVRPYVGTPRRRVEATFTTDTKSLTAARRKRGKVVAGLEERANLADVRRPTVDQLLDDWLERSESSKALRTMQGYRSRAGTIRRRLGALRADTVTLDDVSAMYHDLRTSGMSEASLLEIHRVLQAAFTWALDMERIARPLRLKRVKPKHEPPEVSPPDADTYRRLLTGLPDAEWARAVALLAFSGMRRGEVVGLRWDDVHAPTVEVRHSVTEVTGQRQHVGPTKSKRVRAVELPPEGFAVLDLQRAYVTDACRGDLPEWVFPDWNSWRLSLPRRPGSVSIAWGRYRRRMGADGVRLHDVRHFYATHALAAGRALHAVAAQLGHVDPATTLRVYGHATDSGRSEVAQTIGELLKPPAGPGSSAPTPPDTP